MHRYDHFGFQPPDQRVHLIVGEQVVRVVHGHQQHVDVAHGGGDVNRPLDAVVADVQEADTARVQPEHHVGKVAQSGRAGVQILHAANLQITGGELAGRSQD